MRELLVGKGPLHPELVGPSWHLTSLGEAVCQREGTSWPAVGKGEVGAWGAPPVPAEGEDPAAFTARCQLAQRGSSGKLLGTARRHPGEPALWGGSGPWSSLGPPFPQAPPLLGPRAL